MTNSLRSLLILPFVAASLAAQALPGVRASTNVRGEDYPRVLPDLRVTFRIKAPNAQEVQFDLGKRYLAQKTDDGYWTATTEPQVPGFHYYWLVMDDEPLNDPASETFYGVGKQTSGIEIPEPGVDFYDAKDVPHGDVRERWYHSETTDSWRRFYIYTPPDYDGNAGARYPVLYLQHGGGEDETGWPAQGRVSFIMDNLIAEGRAKPMLIVMGQGYARRPGEPEVPLRPPPATPGTAPAAVPPDFSKMFSAFEDVMIQDLIPTIDST
ncbi:MAG TPA: alpha/beta hydrolase-fold protein, partial [Opitutaceae bacterium]|nr:alpha/beta hydrolase-fold protein [Opitutaceae bacterium]